MHFSDQTVRNRLHVGGMRTRRLVVGPVHTAQLDWHLPENSRIGRSAIGIPLFLRMRAGSHCAHVKESEDAICKNVMLPASIIQHNRLGIGSGEKYLWRVSKTSTC